MNGKPLTATFAKNYERKVISFMEMPLRPLLFSACFAVKKSNNIKCITYT